MTEVGSELIPSLPSFQLDRARLDESLLGLAEKEGCHIVRPARVVDTDLGWPRSRVRIEFDGKSQTIDTHWVIDASGRQAYLARRGGLMQPFKSHQTAARWGRWRGVLDMDGADVLGADERDSSALHSISASRRLCTNHFMGRGWWCWLIPLQGGETSVGLVYDKRLFQLPPGESNRQRYEDFVRSRDGLGELLAEAKLDEGDFQSYDHLAYCASKYMEPGWGLIGDAASFLDPYYSPGLDHCAISAYTTATILERELDGELAGESLKATIQEHNKRFARSFQGNFEALYENKYELMGEPELIAASFYMDTAMYYLGVISPVLREPRNMCLPAFGQDKLPVRLAGRWMRFVNRRLVKIARGRHARGETGCRSVGWRSMCSNFGSAQRRITNAHMRGLRLWFLLELREFWSAAVSRLQRA